MRIAILNYGVGNIFSLKKAFENVSSQEVRVLNQLNRYSIKSLDILVLPGVGHFSVVSKRLSKYKDVILEGIERGLGIFGVCLGMQLLGGSSEEGSGEGLRIIEGRTRKIPGNVKLPHMGWNNVRIIRQDELFDGINDNSFFYFAHSYYLEPERRDVIITETEYGTTFPSTVKCQLIVGTQYHPEKSGSVGLRLIDNYLRMVRK